MDQTRSMVTVKLEYYIPSLNHRTGLQVVVEEARVPQGVRLIDSWGEVVKQLRLDRFTYGSLIRMVSPVKFLPSGHLKYHEIVAQEGDKYFSVGSVNKAL